MSAGHPATEDRNPNTMEIDLVDSGERVEMIMREDAVAVAAARAAGPELARLVDATLDRLADGGRIHYAGAGASGRLATVDATEATPTFGVDPELFTAHFPGGATALLDSTIDLEDAQQQGIDDLGSVRPADVVVGVTASGTTAYVRGALGAARTRGALTALITSHRGSPLADLADIVVVADTGPEAVAGSTRLKAGTATKVLINAYSTAVLVGQGRTYSNLMVGLVATNTKLHDRSVSLLAEGSGADETECRAALAECGGRVPLALVRLLTGAPLSGAAQALDEGGSVRAAVRRLTATDTPCAADTP